MRDANRKAMFAKKKYRVVPQEDAEFVNELTNKMGDLRPVGASKKINNLYEGIDKKRISVWDYAFGNTSPWERKRKGNSWKGTVVSKK